MHPNRNQLESFIHGRLEDHERMRIEAHIADCDSCCETLRSIPHDSLIAGLQQSDTRDQLSETKLFVDGDTGKTVHAPNIPKELLDHSRYRIVEQLGAGGMGVVFRAEHRLMERQVALKVVNARLLASETAVERFRMEVRAAAKLSHRNIVAAHDAEQEGDLHFLVMEFIEGTDLAGLIGRRGKLSVLHACNYTMQAALGLQHALEQGMVHRDIKPHNLMRTPKGTIKILDFGLARFASQQRTEDEESGLTDEGVTLGTPDYIAPEQARDAKRADIRADIYSLGCTLYFLLSGQPPFPNGTAMEKVLAHIERDPEPIEKIRTDVSVDVIDIVKRMMSKDPAQRYQTPVEVADALKPFARPDENRTVASSMQASPQVTIGPQKQKQPPTMIALDQLDLPEPSTHPVTSKGAYAPSPRQRPSNKKTGPPKKTFLVSGTVLLLLIAVFCTLPFMAEQSPGPSSPPASNDQSSDLGEIATGFDDLPSETDDGWIDLMPQIDVTRDSVGGQWSKNRGNLSVDSSDSASLSLPFVAPQSYDFEVEFTRNTGRNSVALHFVAGEGQASFDLDAWNEHLAGIQSIGGNTLRESGGDRMTLINGQRYRASISVRPNLVQAWLDNRLIDTYSGDGSNLEMISIWRLPRSRSRSMGLGSYNNSTTFHSIRFRDRADNQTP